MARIISITERESSVKPMQYSEFHVVYDNGTERNIQGRRNLKMTMHKFMEQATRTETGRSIFHTSYRYE